MTNESMTEEKKNKIALGKARDFKDGSPDPFLAQMEWEEYLMDKQHKFNKRLVIITVIATIVAAILGGLIQRYSPDITSCPKTRTHIETPQGRR